MLAVCLVTVNLVPAIVAVWLGFSAAASAVMLSGMAALIATTLVGVRFGLAMAAVLALGHVIGYPTASSPLLAGLVMGVLALLYGLTARRGVSSAIVLAPVSIAFMIAEPATLVKEGDTLVNALAIGLAALLGGLWGAGAGAILSRVVPKPPLVGVGNRQAWLFALIIAVTTGVAMAVVVAMQLQHGGAWLLLTIFMVVQPVAGLTRSKTLARVAGTLLGFAVALVIGLVLEPGTLTLVIGLLLGIVAITFKLNPRRPYWLYAAILTPAIVLMEGSASSVLDTDFARLWFTLIGAGIALLLVEVVRLLKLDERV